MVMNMAAEIAALGRMTAAELRKKHLDVFGEQTRSGNKEYLRKRLAWRIQANVHGDLSARARERAEELANDVDIRTTAPKVKPVDVTDSTITTTQNVTFDHDARLPMPGAILCRPYKGRDIVIHVLPRGFEYEGQVYRTLSAVAQAVTHTHINGYEFFKLNQRKNGVADE